MVENEKMLFLNCGINNIRIILFILIFALSCTNPHLLSTYYKKFELNNGNYLIIKQNEIYTYNKLLKKEKKFLFENESQKIISKNDIQKIFYFKNNLPQNNIFLFIKDYMYIFTNNGEFVKSIRLFEKSFDSFYKILFPYKYINKSNLNLYYYYIIVSNNCKNNIIIDIYEYNYSFNHNVLFFSKVFSISKSFFKQISNCNNFNCTFTAINNNDYKILKCNFNNEISKKYKIDIENKQIIDISKTEINEQFLFNKNLSNAYYTSVKYLNNKISNDNRFLNNIRILQPGGDTVSGEGEGGGNNGSPGSESGSNPPAGSNSGAGANTGITGNEQSSVEGEEGGKNNGNNQNNNFNFDFERGQTNMTRDEIRNNRDSIMQNYEKGNSYKIEGEGFEIRVAPMNEKGEKGSTSIDFLECEKKLREAYELDDSAVLSVFQTQTERTNEKSLTNRVQYVVYDENNNQLDLSVCQDEAIRINFALRNDTNLDTKMLSNFAGKGIDILNSSDPFFNDICYSYSDGGSDIILKDRISEIYQNFSVCDSDCEYESIDTENLTVSCNCPVSNDTDSDDDDDEESTNLKSIILNVFDDSTFGVIKCYKLVFNIKNKLKNIGFWIFSIIIIVHIPLFVLFFKNGITPITNYIINEMKKYHYYVSKSQPPKKKIKVQKEQENNELIINKITNNTTNNEENEETGNRINVLTKKGKRNSIQNNNLMEQTGNNKNTEINKIILIEENNSKIDEKSNKKNTYSLIKIDANNTIDKKPEESNYTLHNYEYETAIEYENRTFWRILYIILLSKDNLLNTFLLKSPLESQPLRICLLLFSYTSDLALNTLFYFSDNISDKYHYTGKYLFWYTIFNNLIISVISTILSIILGLILSSMTDSKSRIEEEFKKEEVKLRENKDYIVTAERKEEIMTSITKSLKCLKIKMVIFVIIDLVILLFFYYFTTAFCSVYSGTQTSWISDAIVSIIIAIPIEVAIALVITIVYKIALKYKCKFLYKISMILA